MHHKFITNSMLIKSN